MFNKLDQHKTFMQSNDLLIYSLSESLFSSGSRELNFLKKVIEMASVDYDLFFL